MKHRILSRRAEPATRVLKSTLMAVVAATFASVSFAAAPDVNEIMKKAVQNVYSRSEESTYSMKLIDGDGNESLRKMQVFYRRDGDDSAKLVVKFDQPADIRGTALLSVLEKGKPADQWLYLPKLKKTRKIRGGNENEAFLGSDFTVGDLTSSDNDQERYAYQLTNENKPCGGNTCYELTASPKAGVDPASLPYSKRILDIRKDDFVSTRVEFYDPAGKLMKTLELKDIKLEDGKYWIANSMEMKDVRSGHRTLIEVVHRSAGKAPANSVFTQSFLERD